MATSPVVVQWPPAEQSVEIATGKWIRLRMEPNRPVGPVETGTRFETKAEADSATAGVTIVGLHEPAGSTGDDVRAVIEGVEVLVKRPSATDVALFWPPSDQPVMLSSQKWTKARIGLLDPQSETRPGSVAPTAEEAMKLSDVTLLAMNRTEPTAAKSCVLMLTIDNVRYRFQIKGREEVEVEPIGLSLSESSKPVKLADGVWIVLGFASGDTGQPQTYSSRAKALADPAHALLVPKSTGSRFVSIVGHDDKLYVLEVLVGSDLATTIPIVDALQAIADQAALVVRAKVR